MFDAAIIGTGPAGLSAALTLRIHQKDILWLGTKEICEKVALAEQINNYPGVPSVSGGKLAEAFRAQAAGVGLEPVEAMVNTVLPMGNHFALMAGSEFYEAKAVLLTTGITAAGCLPGEVEKLGRGVSYCATCDGMLYRGKTIAVISTAQRFEHEVAYLASPASRVLLFPRYSPCKLGLENVEVMDTLPVKILGEQRVEAVVGKNGTVYPVDGVFCLRTAIQLDTLFQGLETSEGHIVVNRQMQTNLSGVYAAGDCTGRPYQYAKAVGEGNVAAHAIVSYLSHWTE